MAKIFDKMKDLMFGEYEDDDDFYEDDYAAAPAPVRETSSYGLRDASADYSAPAPHLVNLPEVQATILRSTV